MSIELEPFDQAAPVDEPRESNEALAKLGASVAALIAAAPKYKAQRDTLLPYATHKMYCALLDYHDPVDRGCTCGLAKLLDETRAGQ